MNATDRAAHLIHESDLLILAITQRNRELARLMKANARKATVDANLFSLKTQMNKEAMNEIKHDCEQDAAQEVANEKRNP